MSKKKIVIAVLGFALFSALIIGAIRHQINSSNDVNLLLDRMPISKVDMTLVTYRNSTGKRKVVISEKDLLDSLNTAFRYHSKSLRIDLPKAHDVYVLLDVYKGNNKASLEVFNSKYTGWVLIVGNYKFTNDYVFRFVQRYL